MPAYRIRFLCADPQGSGHRKLLAEVPTGDGRTILEAVAVAYQTLQKTSETTRGLVELVKIEATAGAKPGPFQTVAHTADLVDAEA